MDSKGRLSLCVVLGQHPIRNLNIIKWIKGWLEQSKEEC